jgi:ribA/ribD-fused uncharacterized protein
MSRTPRRITGGRIKRERDANRALRYVIRDFDGFNDPDNVFRFLSNFYVPDVPYTTDLYPGVDFMTTEHLYQAAKAVDAEEWEAIALADSPGIAKSLGQQCDIRPDWEAIKFSVMRHCLDVKFATGREEAIWLRRTGKSYLVEGTDWGDTIWGVDNSDTFEHGANWLGVLLMAKRAELVAIEDMHKWANKAWAEDIRLDNLYRINPLHGVDL